MEISADGTTFWTYDNPASSSFKMDYVRENKLGGVVVWEMSNEMPNGLLLKTIVGGLAEER